MFLQLFLWPECKATVMCSSLFRLEANYIIRGIYSHAFEIDTYRMRTLALSHVVGLFIIVECYYECLFYAPFDIQTHEKYWKRTVMFFLSSYLSEIVFTMNNYLKGHTKYNDELHAHVVIVGSDSDWDLFANVIA